MILRWLWAPLQLSIPNQGYDSRLAAAVKNPVIVKDEIIIAKENAQLADGLLVDWMEERFLSPLLINYKACKLTGISDTCAFDGTGGRSAKHTLCGPPASNVSTGSFLYRRIRI